MPDASPSSRLASSTAASPSALAGSCSPILPQHQPEHRSQVARTPTSNTKQNPSNRIIAGHSQRQYLVFSPVGFPAMHGYQRKKRLSMISQALENRGSDFHKQNETDDSPSTTHDLLHAFSLL
jgi:hypothetical protein